MITYWYNIVVSIILKYFDIHNGIYSVNMIFFFTDLLKFLKIFFDSAVMDRYVNF